MASDRNHTAPPPPVYGRDAMALALEQTQNVKEKVELCADNLGSSNDIAKKKIAEGTNPLSAHQSLADNEKVQCEVQECADDLHEVTETLADWIGQMQEQTKIALADSQNALANTEAALATAREGKRKAKLRALHDSMTGLANRDLFDDRLGHAIAQAKRHDWTLAVMFLDLDRFKCINDTHGHAIGDGILKEVAKRLSEHARDEDTVCRNGGDEFLYLLMNPRGSENIERIAGVLLKNIAQPIDMDDLQLVIKSSIGIAVYADNGTTGEQLIRNADAAMYRAKKSMTGCVFFNALDTEGTSAGSPGLRS